MKLIVGLGNPGAEYRATRHNVGFRVVEEIAARTRIVLDGERYQGLFGVGEWNGREVALLQPLTSMNHSGRAVAEAIPGLRIEDPARDLLVIVDDLDLPLGRLRLRPRGSDGGQRGLRDVIGRLGNDAVPRLRFGVSRPPVGVDPIRWVLDEFAAGEQAALGLSVARAADAAACFAGQGIDAAMDRFNGWPDEPTESPT